MVTKLSGGNISARIALTMEAQYAAAIGDPVYISGPYECSKGDATHSCIGYVVVPNVVRTTTPFTSTFPAAETPGPVSVETVAAAVREVVAGAGGVTAGQPISISATGTYVAGAVADASFVGWALTTAAAGSKFDLLWVR